MMQPKITVVIPTRERCDVLEHALRTVTCQDYDNLEIIVSDNFSNDATREVVSRANDRRLRYLNTGQRLSMSHNWEFALEHVREGWVTVIGDDDGLLPGALSSVATLISNTNAKAIRTNHCTYDWPGTGTAERGRLIVPLASGIQWRSSAAWLDKVIHGRARYTQLPMLYNGGFVHISVLEKVKVQLGRFFASANPDIFSAIAVAKATGDFLYVKDPLAIVGTSRHSNGNSSFSLDKNRNPAPQSKFQQENNIPVHADFPSAGPAQFPLSLQACVYEAHLQSLDLGQYAQHTNHREQLPLILATSGKHQGSVAEWASRFAEMHRLNLDDAKQSARRARYHLGGMATLRKVIATLGSVVMDDPPVRNVHEASIAASVIRQRPGKLHTLRFFFNQLLGATRG